MISFELYTQIYRPPNQVFSFVATPENDFQWQYGTYSSTQISKGVIGIGAAFRTVGLFMGNRIECVYEVTEFEPGKRYGFKSRSGPMDSCTSFSFEAVGGHTRVTISTQINPGELFKPGSIAVEKKVKKQCRENLALLKTILEANPAEKPQAL